MVPIREVEGVAYGLLEASDVDVDRLAERVARAGELIALCRAKITSAQLRIEQVTADLDAAEPDA